MHLIVHLGPPKTGSTSIQRALWQSGAALEAAGCHHFRGRKPAEWALQFLYGGHSNSLPPVLRRHFDTVAEARAWSEGCWQMFEAEVAARRAPVTILSSEHLANIADPAGFLDRIAAGFDRVTLVAYARDPVDIYVSELAELIRGGRRFADLPQVHTARYNATAGLRRFETLVGAQNMVIRRFGDAHPAIDFFSVVAACTGRALPPPQTGAGPANRALCGAATAWLLTLNEVQDIQALEGAIFRERTRARDRVIAALAAAPALAGRPPLTLSDPVLEHRLRGQADETVAWLNATYLDTPLPRAALSDARQHPMPGPGRLRARLRDGIMGHMTPEAMQDVARALIRRGSPDHVSPGTPVRDQSRRTCVPISTSS